MRNDSPFHRMPAHRAPTRREFLWHAGGGLGGVALASMLSHEAFGFLGADTPASGPPASNRSSD